MANVNVGGRTFKRIQLLPFGNPKDKSYEETLLADVAGHSFGMKAGGEIGGGRSHHSWEAVIDGKDVHKTDLVIADKVAAALGVSGGADGLYEFVMENLVPAMSYGL